jgi:hypothetical protein
MPHRQVQTHHQRALDAHRIIETRRDAGIEVVEYIDAADKAYAAIDHRQLAMHAPQAVAAHDEAPGFGPIGQYFGTGRGQAAAHAGLEITRAEAIHQHPHRDAAPRRVRQRGGHAAPGWHRRRRCKFRDGSHVVPARWH